MKEYFATRMPSASECFPKDADSASVEMVGRETVEHAPVRLYNQGFITSTGPTYLRVE